MKNKVMLIVAVVAALAIVLIGAATPVLATDTSDAQAVVDRARVTFNDFMHDQNYAWLHEHMKDAKGLLIFPQIIKGGFVIGGSGGTGVLVLRDEKTCNWSEPAFYTVGSVTLGLQIGGESAEVLMMVMSQKAADSLLASSFKFGGDTSIALGPVGVGAKANITADFISFAKAKGIYAGLNLEGSIVKVRDGLNSAYYGKAVTPADIVIKKDVASTGSGDFLTTLKKMSIRTEQCTS